MENLLPRYFSTVYYSSTPGCPRPGVDRERMYRFQHEQKRQKHQLKNSSARRQAKQASHTCIRWIQPGRQAPTYPHATVKYNPTLVHVVHHLTLSVVSGNLQNSFPINTTNPTEFSGCHTSHCRGITLYVGPTRNENMVSMSSLPSRSSGTALEYSHVKPHPS